ncbi:MAG: TIGR03915 family putative DNA repair protein [Pseudomonadota bacterium]|uniref:TIGR03915 family putative DNA repair protein n=1 Tax=Salinicola sp. 4072 TaxID=3082157 RepID=UPI002ECCBBA1|nr:TIGR03915 family putative DNA repair protein [Pseudomonadota bacterium]
MHRVSMPLASCVAWASDFDEWRQQARQLLQAGIPPSRVTWHDGEARHDDLFASPAVSELPPGPGDISTPISIGRDQLALLRNADRYRPRGSEQPRWPLLYRVLWRVVQGDVTAMHPADEDGRVLHQRWHAIKREAHHMHAFLRFHRCDDAHGERYVAWFEPAHDVLDLGAEHFADRMGGSRWIIATPEGGVSWDGTTLDYRVPCPGNWTHEARAAANRSNADEEHALWRTYFVSTFNPARLNHKVMTQHMPQRFWRHLSEGDLIPAMEAKARHGGQRLAQETSVGQRQGKTLSVKLPADATRLPGHQRDDTPTD